MSAEILPFPNRSARDDTSARPDGPAVIVPIEAHRARARVLRTLHGVFYLSPTRDPETPTAA